MAASTARLLLKLQFLFSDFGLNCDCFCLLSFMYAAPADSVEIHQQYITQKKHAKVSVDKNGPVKNLCISTDDSFDSGPM